MRIIEQENNQFHSFESAFSHIPHHSIASATQLVENFLVHVGTTRYVSYPKHFLVGKEFCIDFTNERDRNVALFGVIVGCMRDNEIASDEKGGGENTFFILQYNQDVLAIARSMGSEVPPLRLICSELAWGGCIAYERKTCCRRCPLSVIRNIDQATGVCNFSDKMSVNF